MSSARTFLRHLHTAVQRSDRRPLHDPTVTSAIKDLSDACAALVRSTGSAEVSFGNPVTLDGQVIEGAAIEFGGLVDGLRSRSIQVLVLVAPIDPADVEALVRIVGGADLQIPGESVRLDDRPSARPVTATASFTRLIAAAADVVRSATEQIRLDLIAESADPLVRGAIGDPDDAFARAVAGFGSTDIADRSVGVALLSAVMGRRLGVQLDDLGMLGVAALMRDIALIRDPAIDPREHPVHGAEAILLAAGPGHEIAASVALEHHVHADGSGYPSIGRTPHPYSQIVGVADAFAQLVAGSPRRASRTPAEAMRILAASAGAEFEAEVVAALIDSFGVRPAGSLVRLDTGEVALVGGRSGRAIVVTAADGTRLEVPEPVDLVQRTVIGDLLPEEAGIAAADLPELRP